MHVQGTVIHGKKQARLLGYPTANVAYDSTVSRLETGVWTCWMKRVRGWLPALAVVGMWSQENGLPSLEIHLLDYTEDLYGERVEVVMGEKQRSLYAFDQLDALRKQIDEDVTKGKEWFRTHSMADLLS